MFQRRILVSFSQGLADRLSPPPSFFRLRSAVVTLMRAFADGFFSSLAGGLVYTMILVIYFPSELELAAWRVLSLCVVFGSVETWRVRTGRTIYTMKAGLFWAFAGSMVMWFAIGNLGWR